jgi:hypothetical protein
MSFKDQLKKDIGSVFFNDEEFTDQHEINGKTMDALIDDNKLFESPSGGNAQVLGVFGGQTTLYVKADQYGSVPKRGALIMIDGQRFTVSGVTVEMGVYQITIERWVSNGVRF